MQLINKLLDKIFANRYNSIMYIIYVLLYAFIIGFHEIFKKQTREKSNPSVVLVMFTTTAFLLSLIWIPFGVAVSWKFVLIFALKGFLLTFSWFIILKILKDADISTVTTLNLVSVVFTFILGITVFGESVSAFQIVGIILILIGIIFMSLVNRQEKGQIKAIQIIFILIAAIITTASEVIDKYTTTYLTNFQVQFWFLFFTFVFSWIFFGIDCFKSKQFLIKKHDLKNFWIYLVGISLFVGDLMLFLSYNSPNSQMIIITILAKLKVLITTFAGILIFKEKNITKKILLTILIIIGAVFVSIL